MANKQPCLSRDPSSAGTDPNDQPVISRRAAASAAMGSQHTSKQVSKSLEVIWLPGHLIDLIQKPR